MVSSASNHACHSLDLGGRRVRSPWNSRAEIGPFGDFSDAEGYLAATKRAAVLGYEGKWAIHPSQIELANHGFTPSKAEVTKARRILEAMDQAAKNGKGAVSVDGRLIDIASIRMAEALLNKANAIAALLTRPGVLFACTQSSRFPPDFFRVGNERTVWPGRRPFSRNLHRSRKTPG